MKIFFYGSPPWAIPSLQKIVESGHEVALVITQPDRPSGRGRHAGVSAVKAAALNMGLPIHQPVKIRKDSFILEKLEEQKPDLNVVVAYGQIIQASVIYFPPFHSLNLHFSLLPSYRGAAPVQWALYHGERTTGVSIFELNEKMDEGKILAQKKVYIQKNEDAIRLQSRLSEIGSDLLVATISNIDKITPVEQDNSLATYAPLIKKEDGRINWQKTASEISNHVRAFHPWPSSFCFFKKQRIKLISVSPLDESPSPDKAYGKIWDIRSEGISILCGGPSLLLVKRLQPENKKEMDAYSFCLGADVKPGDRFL
ncbi:MAG: methionyl-tRNA formyltransferase [Candidatus Aminicenantes bacterium]|nr:methionyl-tRNA formyltransferase [Candidatus Aminicenantes bacterium]